MSSRRRSRSRDRKNVPSKLRMDNNSPAVRITGKTLYNQGIALVHIIENIII